MTILWLVVWVLSITPNVTFQPQLNSWALALIICVALDLMK